LNQCKKKLGPVLIQLPKTVKFDYDIAEHFYQLLAKNYKPYKFAMEVSDESWLTVDSQLLMTKYNIAFVISHFGGYFPYAEINTAKDIYFRFYGPGTLYNTKYCVEEMPKFARLLKKWLRQGHELWIFFNNDWFCYGIQNTITLCSLLTK